MESWRLTSPSRRKRKLSCIVQKRQSRTAIGDAKVKYFYFFIVESSRSGMRSVEILQKERLSCLRLFGLARWLSQMSNQWSDYEFVIVLTFDNLLNQETIGDLNGGSENRPQLIFLLSPRFSREIYLEFWTSTDRKVVCVCLIDSDGSFNYGQLCRNLPHLINF